MSPSVVRVIGLCGTAIYATFIGWLFAVQPRTTAEIRGGVAASLGAYRVDEASFQEGIRFFRADQFVEARSAFERADPAGRDARTQFYIAYAYYRQGWGRLYNDDELFRRGLDAVDRAMANAAGGRVVVNDPNLKMTSADELRAELQRGLTREASDLNPMRVFRERK